MAVSMYLRIPGVVGGSKDQGHVGAVNVLAWSWGMSNSGSALGGAGKGSWQDMTITAFDDIATSALMLSTMQGTRYDSMTLTLVYGTGNGPTDQYVMSNVIVTSVSSGGSSGEDRFTANYSFSFSAVSAKISNKQWHWDLSTQTGG